MWLADQLQAPPFKIGDRERQLYFIIFVTLTQKTMSKSQMQKVEGVQLHKTTKNIFL